MGAQFQVFVSGMSGGSADDWKRAMNAPESELPELSEQQKDVARRMEIPEKEYARGVLVNKYSEERQIERGKKLGEHIDSILDGLGSSYYRLQALVREGLKSRWVARITTPKGIKNVAVPFEIADDVVDSDTVQDIERLKQIILKAVGREELINPNALT
jgi:hypothetical protein